MTTNDKILDLDYSFLLFICYENVLIGTYLESLNNETKTKCGSMES